MRPFPESAALFGLLVLAFAATVLVAGGRVRRGDTPRSGTGLAGAPERLARAIEPRRAALVLGALVAVLAVLGALESYADLPGSAFAVEPPEKQNVTTYVSTLILLCATTLAAVLARDTGGDGDMRLWWALLAACLFFLALDEATEVHERIASRLDLDDALPLAPAAIGVGAALLATVAQARRFPPAAQLIGASVVFAVLSQLVDIALDTELTAKHVIEESLEMIASSLMVVALLLITRALWPSPSTDRHA